MDVLKHFRPSSGPSVVDVMTAGAHGVPRKITDTIEEREFYPNHEATFQTQLAE
jgi:hypothetical protein